MFDAGDLELPLGDAATGPEARLRSRRHRFCRRASGPSCWAGEHLVTLGAFRAAFPEVPGHRTSSILTPTPTCGRTIWGWRSPTPACCAAAGSWSGTGGSSSSASAPGTGRSSVVGKGPRVLPTTLTLMGLETCLDQLGDKPVYFTVDLDVLDPSVFPGTGTPEPGGVSFEALRRAVTAGVQPAQRGGLRRQRALARTTTPAARPRAVACKIVREMLLALAIRPAEPLDSASMHLNISKRRR